MLSVYIGIGDAGAIAIAASIFSSACILAVTVILVAVIGRD